MTTKLVAIHQPNLFPWLGFFDKIMQCDEFIFLDHVRASIKQHYVRRVQLCNGGKADWLTIPVRDSGSSDEFPKLTDLHVDLNPAVKRKQLRMIELNYRTTPFFSEVFPLVTDFYNDINTAIVERNIQFICTVCSALQVSTPMHRSSKMNCTSASNELLIEIVAKRSGTGYLTGGGASGYQDDARLREMGIDVYYQNFQHPNYSSKGLRGLSILDALFHLGFEGTRKMLECTSLLASC